MNKLNLKGLFVGASLLGALALSGCAKSEKTTVYAAEQRYLEAWVAKNHPDAEKTALGTWVLDQTPGTGDAFDGQSYVLVEYTVRDVDGNVTATSDRKIAQQVGTYDKSYYYGSVVWETSSSSLPVGVADMLEGMKIGGEKTSLVPAWLMSYKHYKNVNKYLNVNTDNSSALYTVKLVGLTNNILKTQVDSMEIYADKYLDGVDSTYYGFYYKQLTAPTDTNAFSSDTTIYINYIGRLLNGQVFDTTIEDTAKFYNIYSSSTTYTPAKITWAEKASGITLTAGGSSSSSDGSSVIPGFYTTLWKMRKYEKAVGMFYSLYGYGSSGSGSRIPAYAPLVFEIEIVDEED